MEDKRFLNVNDVAVYMDVSVPKAYKIIRTLNAELNEKGTSQLPERSTACSSRKRSIAEPHREGR